jgi:hypothetical protein
VRLIRFHGRPRFDGQAPAPQAAPARGTGRRDKESGQVLIEFALVLPVLILLVVGIIDFGFAFNTWNSAQNAAREGARVAAVSNNAPTIKNRALVTGGPINLQDPEISLSCNRPVLNGVVNNTFYDCTQGLQAGGANGATLYPTGQAPGGQWAEAEGDIVQVNVTHDYKFMTPLPRLIGLGSSITLHASIQTRYEG